MTKTISRIILAVCLLGLTAFFVLPAAAASLVTIGLNATDVLVGSDFTITIDIDNVTNFDAAQYDITYDADVLQVTSVTNGLIGSTEIPVSAWAFIPAGIQGTIKVINNVSGTPGISGTDGYLSEIHFHVTGAANDQSSIEISDLLLGDNTAQEIEVTWPNPVTVTIVDSVVADFVSDVREVLVGQPVSFTALPSNGSGTYTYSWDFNNDGTPDSALANPSYSYTSAGLKTVSLTVTDTFDGSDTKTKTDYITVYPGLAAGCTANVSETATGVNIQFSSASTTGGKTSYSYAWDFDNDGTADSTAANPVHSYSDSGIYTVTLTVIDGLGNPDSDTITITIYKLGDANGDDSVNMTDVTYIEHILFGHTGYLATAWADANQDGKWTALDITAVELIIIPE